VAALCLAAAAPAGATPAVTLLDLIEIESGYTTIVYNYYQTVAPQRMLDGARTGLLAYVRSRGISGADLPVQHARTDGRGVVPAIDQQVGRIVQRYGDRVEVRALVYATIRGELAALKDPYSTLFSKAELAKFSAAIDGTAFGGIGVVLSEDATSHSWRVDRVFPAGPAAAAGLQAGDTIVTIDGATAAGLSNDAIVALLRGRTGSVVRLGIERAGATLGPLAVTRATVTPPSVTAKLLPGGVGYVALRSFDLSAADQLRRELVQLAAQGARATIFDLRGNGGGYEQSAVRVASLFVASGPVVTLEERRGKRLVRKADGKALAAKPLIVLVDGDSASASELVAAAIRDHGAGRLVGTKTYGKGVVQSMFPLPDGSAIKLTTARYFTPRGRNIDGAGLEPDVAVTRPADAAVGTPGRDPQLDRALELLSPTPSP
jgi:carboxyl-terminal processing protease